MLELSSAARTVFHNSTFYSKGFLPPKDSPADSIIHSPYNYMQPLRNNLKLLRFMAFPLYFTDDFHLGKKRFFGVVIAAQAC